MKQENEMLIIKAVLDRAIQRGNIFTSMEEVNEVINAFNSIATELKEEPSL